MLSTILLLAVPAVSAFTLSGSANQLHVVWRSVKGKNAHAMTVFDAAGTTLYDQTCEGDRIASNSFAGTPLSFDVDDDGYGNLTYGSNTYDVDDDYDDVDCNKMFNEEVLLIDCLVKRSGNAQLTGVAATDEADCFGDNNDKFARILGFRVEQDDSEDWNIGPDSGWQPTGNETISPNATSTDIVERAAATDCVRDNWSTKCKHRNPYQTHHHRQMTRTGRTSIGVSSFKSVTQSWTATAHFYSWFDAQYSVSETKKTGNHYGCPKPKHNKATCLWHATAYTGYRGRNHWAIRGSPVDCPLGEHGESKCHYMKSPNKQDCGVPFYCVVGNKYCGDVGSNYWAKRHPGPPPTC